MHFVTIRLRPAEFDFDTHTDNFSRLRKLLPPSTKDWPACSIGKERGLFESTAIMVAGELGAPRRSTDKAGAITGHGPCLP